MLTSHDSSPDARTPLRLALAPVGERQVLDGAWWPQSRHLPTELADLVDHFPPERARIERVELSPPDWDDAPERIPVTGRTVEAGSLPDDPTHVLLVSTRDGATLTLLVVPAGFTRAQGEEAMLAASTPGNQHPAGELLVEVTENASPAGHDEWSDGGDTWWEDESTAPSYR